MTEYILCAAVWFDDGKEYVHQPKNISTGYVVCGWRHHNCFAVVSILEKEGRCFDERLQGFLTNTNRFVSREESAKIAYEAGQIAVKKNELYSEDVW